MVIFSNDLTFISLCNSCRRKLVDISSFFSPMILSYKCAGIIKTFASASPTFVECLNVVLPETKMRVWRDYEKCRKERIQSNFLRMILIYYC